MEADDLLNESHTVTILFLNLPPSYVHVVSRLETQAIMTIQKATAEILHEVNRKKIMTKNRGSSPPEKFANKVYINGHPLIGRTKGKAPLSEQCH